MRGNFWQTTTVEEKFGSKCEIFEPIDAFAVDSALITSPILNLNMGQDSNFDDVGVGFGFEQMSTAESEGCLLDLFDNLGRDDDDDDFLSESIHSPKRDYFHLYSTNPTDPNLRLPSSSFHRTDPSSSFGGVFGKFNDFSSGTVEPEFGDGRRSQRRPDFQNSFNADPMESPRAETGNTYAALASINPYADPSPVRNFTYQKRRMF